MHEIGIREKVEAMRKRGMTYSEICLACDGLSKSTVATWCRDIRIGSRFSGRIRQLITDNLALARQKSVLARSTKRAAYFADIRRKYSRLPHKCRDRNTALIALAVLYLGEGTKTRKGALTFANSDSGIVCLFLRLLRRCYPVANSKFRCTVQCRADQDADALESYWSTITGIPRPQFYSARIDPRSRGKPSTNPAYKGVCRIDYFSAEVFTELLIVGNLLAVQGR